MTKLLLKILLSPFIYVMAMLFAVLMVAFALVITLLTLICVIFFIAVIYPILAMANVFDWCRGDKSLLATLFGCAKVTINYSNDEDDEDE